MKGGRMPVVKESIQEGEVVLKGIKVLFVKSCQQKHCKL